MKDLLKKINQGELGYLINNAGVEEITAITHFSHMKTPGYCGCCGEYTEFSVPLLLELDFGVYRVALGTAIESKTRFGNSSDIEVIKHDIGRIKPFAYMTPAKLYEAQEDSLLSVSISTKSIELAMALANNYEAELEIEGCGDNIYEVCVLGAHAEYLQDEVARIFVSPQPNQVEALKTIKQNVISFAKNHVENQANKKSVKLQKMEVLHQVDQKFGRVGRYNIGIREDVASNRLLYEVLDLEDNEIWLWSMEDILNEINRDRSADWTDYDETDFIEGWVEWVEGEYYSMLLVRSAKQSAA